MDSKEMPLYLSLKNSLLEGIRSGVWKPGAMLPAESELCEMYNVSRTTVRQALMGLQNEGIVHKQKGKGTFVEQKKITYGFSKVAGFSKQMEQRGIKTRHKMLSTRVVPADEKTADILKVALKDPVLSIHRLRFADDEPIMLSTSNIPWKMAPNLFEEMAGNDNLSIMDYLSVTQEIPLLQAHDTFEPILLNHEQSRLLETKENGPALHMESIVFTKGYVPVEYSVSVIRGDRCKYYIEYVRE